MATIVDARNLPCPQPVMLTRKALEKGTEVVTIVDNQAARDNVTRLGQSEGCQVSVETRQDGIYLTLRKQQAGQTKEKAPATGIVLFITSDVLGRGDDQQLGSLLMQSFLHTVGGLAASPETVLLINNGVKLATGDSPVLGELRQLEEQGAAVLACGTCLARFGLSDKVAVGEVSNMFIIADTLLKAGKIISL
ncbi:MAG: sulfurtransferase-like selenium metabolism protein YedF [Chloroflexi bacterium]|nr:sulfurtransferase-like selenium metabolism protein YedF [Chloroflexota bacterium]